jgi:hypothetical protein
MSASEYVCERLARSSTAEQTAVDGIHNVICGDHSAAKIATVQALHGLFATLHTVKLDIDVTCIDVQSDMDDMSVASLALSFDIILQFFVPVGVARGFLPAKC